MRYFLKTQILIVFFFVVLTASLHADSIFSVQFQGVNGPVNFQGAEADAATADAAFASSNQWNHFQPGNNPFTANLITSTGATTGASFSTGYAGGYNDGSHALPDSYFFQYNDSGPSTSFTISGLAPNGNFTLFFYAYNSVHATNDRGAIYTVGTSSFTTATGNASSEDPTHAVDGFITGVTSSAGTISGTWNLDPSNQVGEIDWSGFQLDVSSAVAAPEPSTIAFIAGGLLIFGWRRFMKKEKLHA
jgi:PEP-CTERM motif